MFTIESHPQVPYPLIFLTFPEIVTPPPESEKSENSWVETKGLKGKAETVQGRTAKQGIHTQLCMGKQVFSQPQKAQLHDL